MKYPSMAASDFDYTKTALSALNRIPAGLRSHLKQTGDWEDVVAWAFVAAVAGFRGRWTARMTYNAAQRYIYHALKAMGYWRVGSRFTRREVPYSEIEELSDFSKKEV